MSQVKFRTTTESGPVEVMAGWDHPLQEFFMTIFDLASQDEDEDEDVLWSTLSSPDASLRDTPAKLRLRLDLMGITPPDGFWEHVERRERNKTYDLTPTGWMSY